jgi:hypothetical protein
MSVIHKAASIFPGKSSQSHPHHHLLHISLNFFRPTLPDPEQAILSIQATNLARTASTLHVEVKQNNKLCAAGYVTYVVDKHTGVLRC